MRPGTLQNMSNLCQRRLDFFPIGYYHLHPDVSLNFQMNRCYTWAGGAPDMLDEMRAVAPRITTYADFTREFLQLSEQALDKQQVLKGAMYLRAAEFFLFPDDPDKRPARERFLHLIRAYYGVQPEQRFHIPYETGMLSAYRFTPPNPREPRETLVVFGGFDSYIEELFAALLTLRDVGYDVVGFDGPGQGSALEESHLPMTPEWEKPVKAVLDYFHLHQVTLMLVLSQRPSSASNYETRNPGFIPIEALPLPCPATGVGKLAVVHFTKRGSAAMRTRRSMQANGDVGADTTHVVERRPIWAAYAAGVWAMLFALMSFYWALGGELGMNTLSHSIQALRHDPGFLVVVWLTGVAKVLGGLFALTLARGWAQWLPRVWKRVLAVLAWLGGSGLLLYGGIQLVVEALVVAGVMRVGGSVDWAGLRWHVWLWDPFWLLGGILFLLAAWQYGRRPATEVAGVAHRSAR